MNIFKAKRGVQMEGRLFIYLIALFLGALIVVFGYRAVVGINERGAQAALISFQGELEKDVTSLTEVGSVKIAKYKIPAVFSEVCFVDLDNIDVDPLDNPIIEDAVNSGSDRNVFLAGEDNFESLHIDDLGVVFHPNYVCLHPRSSILELKLEGTKYGVGVKVVDKEICERAPSVQNACAALDLFGAGYRVECCAKYQKCCQ
jgi:hypothetical protein